MSAFIFLGILGGSFFITVSLISLLAVFLALDDKDFVPATHAFIVFGLTAYLGTIILIVTRAAINSQPPTRDIHLTVPKDSSVDAQVTSENTTLNLQNL